MTIDNEPSLSISNEDRNLLILLHISGVFFNFIPALFVYIFAMPKDKWTRQEIVEILNFELTFALYYTVLIFSIIGWILVPFIWFANIFGAFLAIQNLQKIQPDNFKFPFVIKFLR
jgi:hypothetical protein